MTLATMLALQLVVSPLAVRPNDNRTPAGTLASGVLTIKLEAVIGAWSPEGSRGPALEFPVFAEQGKAPQIPGPRRSTTPSPSNCAFADYNSVVLRQSTPSTSNPAPPARSASAPTHRAHSIIGAAPRRRALTVPRRRMKHTSLAR